MPRLPIWTKTHRNTLKKRYFSRFLGRGGDSPSKFTGNGSDLSIRAPSIRFGGLPCNREVVPCPGASVP